MPEFRGILDGKGHKILNLDRTLICKNYGTIENITFNTTSFISGGENHGTIKNIVLDKVSDGDFIGDNYGTIENILVNSCNIKSEWSYVTALVYNNYGTISGCTVKGKIETSKGDAAAIALTNRGTIANCNNYAAITATYDASGICNSNTGMITKCANYGSIKGLHSAGIADENWEKIENCNNYAAITATYSTSGICNENKRTITKCANYGSIKGMDSAGIVDENLEKIENCLNVGKADYGIMSFSDTVGSVIQNCVNIGETKEAEYSCFGDILDYYYLSSLPKAEEHGGTVRMIPVDRSDLTNKAAYPTLDFSKDWMMGEQYPVPRQS